LKRIWYKYGSVLIIVLLNLYFALLREVNSTVSLFPGMGSIHNDKVGDSISCIVTYCAADGLDRHSKRV
jgi:hypothetical protein